MPSKVRTARLLNRAACVGCGCDDFNACWDDAHDSTCFWLRVDYPAGLGVCSACPERAAGWDAGDRTVYVSTGGHSRATLVSNRRPT